MAEHDLCQAPTPFIIGVHASYKDAVPPHSGTDRRVWVDLDNGTLEVQGGSPFCGQKLFLCSILLGRFY